MVAVCVTVLLFVTVWTPDESVVTAAPSIQYLVLARLGNGAVPMFMVCCAMYYLALEYLASFWQFRFRNTDQSASRV